MQVELTLKNYRCFSDAKPARISIQNGFTAFVGVNNSGKSSLLRFFYEFRDLFNQLSQPDVLRQALQGSTRAFNFGASVLDLEEVFCNTNNRDLEIHFAFTAESGSKQTSPPGPQGLVVTIPRGRNVWGAQIYLADGPLIAEASTIGITQDSILQVGGEDRAQLAAVFRVSKSLANTLYIGAFRNVLNVGTNTSYFDIVVGQAFVQTWRRFKTGNIKRQSNATYKLMEDIKHIFELESLDINASDDEQTLQIYIDGQSYMLPELGSGLAQFIIVLASAATRDQKPSFILIDEPELNLHPSLQLDFLTTLASYAREGVLFATQSIGLARASADRIYSLRIANDGTRDVRDLETTPRVSEFLGELSFSGYRELGFEKLLLVEGASDVKAVQQFLRMHHKDHKIVLLPLGGSSLIKPEAQDQLEEIKRITENISVLIDSERDAEGAPLAADRKAFVEACASAGISCHVLQRRALENYLTDEGVKKVLGDNYQALEPYQALKDASPAWPKVKNWQIAREMTLNNIETTDLGEFLGEL